MSGEKSGQEGNHDTPRKDPDQDVQPWLGWVAALLVVLIIVVAFALGAERFNQDGGQTGGITPLVGGMSLATTPDPDATIGQDTGADEASASGSAGAAGEPVSSTETMTATITVTGTATVTTAGEDAITGTGSVTNTETITNSPDDPGATATPAPSPTPAPEPTPTLTGEPVVFTRGDVVASQGESITIYAAPDTESTVYDTVGSGVPLTVVEPSSEFPRYPVIRQGSNWVRVRSADGLVGWVVADSLTFQP